MQIIGKKPVVDFYTKPGCHLCDEVFIKLKRLEQMGSIKLNECNIDQNLAWIEEYGMIIPVIKIDGEIIQSGVVDMSVVEEFLLRS